MFNEILCCYLAKNATKNKKSINRNCSKSFSFNGTICKIKKKPMHECYNIQDLLKSDCGPFQLYFYKDLFDPDERSKTLDHQNLTKNTLETVTNEIFSTDVDENQYLIKNFEDEYNLQFFYFRKKIKIKKE